MPCKFFGRVIHAGVKPRRRVGTAREDGITFEFCAALEDGREVVVQSPANEDLAYRAIFEHARSQGTPLYIELDENRVCLAQRPRLGTIISVMPHGENLVVEMTNSHAQHVLHRSNSKFRDLADRLRRAEQDCSIVAMTDADGVIDVRAAEEFRGDSLLDEAAGPPHLPTKFSFAPEEEAQATVSPEKVQSIFDDFMRGSCNFSNVFSGSVPFIYPANDGWIRAHAMAEIMMRRHQVTPWKAWIRGNLAVRTSNDPRCRVAWRWHTAPILPVRNPGDRKAVPTILDPCIFGAPAPVDTWKRALSDPRARLSRTTYDVYSYTRSGKPVTDPQFQRITSELADAQADLLAQIGRYGRGPYPFTCVR